MVTRREAYQPKTRRRRLGAFGESHARGHLSRNGYAILGSNIRLRSGEIDLVARDGQTIVLVEVRTRMGRRFGTPEESVTPKKAERLACLGEEYMQGSGCSAEWRVDVVAIDVAPSGRVSRTNVVKNAVEAPQLPW